MEGDTRDVGRLWTEAMRRGDFEAAWRQTDRVEFPRREAERRGELQWDQSRHLVWDGSSFQGKRVLVRCEHGLGDTIQFARYLPLLRAQASSVIVKAQPALLGLLAGMPGPDHLLDAWTPEPNPPHDVAIECMELPYAFRHTTLTIPSQVPYLHAGFHPPFAPGTRQVGLVWAASGWGTSRTVPLALLAPVANLRGITLHSLQQGPEAAQIHEVPFHVHDLAASTRAITEAAAAMMRLDVVITVDTMAAHLAGALGRPTWLLLKHEADWRWMDARERSPWYPTLRIFRQEEAGVWRSPITAMATKLDNFGLRREA